METPSSLAAVQGGKPLGTERLSVLPLLVQTRDGSSGEAFAEEVTRAIERARGSERQEERLDELEGARRAARRAGFGRERESEGEAHAVEAVFRREDAPVRVEPANAARAPSGGPLQASPESAPSVPSAPRAEAPAGVVAEPVLPSGTALPASQAAVLASSVVPRSAPELALPASGTAPAGEVRALESATDARPGGRTARTAGAPPPSAAPDPALLERAAEILRQIQLHATPHVRRLTLELEPAELGRLSVQLALRAGRVSAIVRGENPETIALLEAREADLLQVLSRRGIAADSVRFELGFGSQRSRRGPRGATPAHAVPSTPTHTRPSLAPRDRSACIDLFA